MKLLAIAIEGVLAREPVDAFASAVSIPDGLWVLESFVHINPILVTGSADQIGVSHFLRSNGINCGVEYPVPRSGHVALWNNRLDVLMRLNHQYRGNLAVVDMSSTVCSTMKSNGALILQPSFPRHRIEVDAEEHVPLRSVPNFWNN